VAPFLHGLGDDGSLVLGEGGGDEVGDGVVRPLREHYARFEVVPIILLFNVVNYNCSFADEVLKVIN
jgi:hypothetical protein